VVGQGGKKRGVGTLREPGEEKKDFLKVGRSPNCEQGHSEKMHEMTPRVGVGHKGLLGGKVYQKQFMQGFLDIRKRGNSAVAAEG